MKFLKQCEDQNAKNKYNLRIVVEFSTELWHEHIIRRCAGNKLI